MDGLKNRKLSMQAPEKAGLGRARRTGSMNFIKTARLIRRAAQP